MHKYKGESMALSPFLLSGFLLPAAAFGRKRTPSEKVCVCQGK